MVRCKLCTGMGRKETLILSRKNCDDNFGLANVYNLMHNELALDCRNRLEIKILLFGFPIYINNISYFY